MEIWKDVVGYEGFYQVSNEGNVRSLERIVPFGNRSRVIPSKARVQVVDKRGYLTVTLSKNNRVKNAKVHRLVAEAFVENPGRLPEVNHKDEDKTNNCAENLEWCNHLYNAVYGTKLERQRQKKSVPIMQCDTDGNPLKTFDSAMQAEHELNGKFTGNINKCLKGETKTAFGYIWRYKEA